MTDIYLGLLLVAACCAWVGALWLIAFVVGYVVDLYTLGGE
jgi:hypothetical protein